MTVIGVAVGLRRTAGLLSPSPPRRARLLSDPAQSFLLARKPLKLFIAHPLPPPSLDQLVRASEKALWVVKNLLHSIERKFATSGLIRTEAAASELGKQKDDATITSPHNGENTCQVIPGPQEMRRISHPILFTSAILS
ncbi:hypothetical protein BDK51DRAFT_41122 [Blyttiomyces helicus]|uniref:Uncharacterized protein n=1 Tax=Blyttiomyces helicus TaxID=388810 RepID=A0A4P9VWH6_9FUNG|nr:hypothetical protein BDK51DRAFT_41122 [Blyttiomyces helicus]|eukprot:RKO84044.1 hypothetical protein BDK51DRAFT_41122 [Blyttiomyces helicus]